MRTFERIVQGLAEWKRWSWNLLRDKSICTFWFSSVVFHYQTDMRKKKKVVLVLNKIGTESDVETFGRGRPTGESECACMEKTYVFL